MSCCALSGNHSGARFPAGGSALLPITVSLSSHFIRQSAHQLGGGDVASLFAQPPRAALESEERRWPLSIGVSWPAEMLYGDIS